jgi:protein arginine kinase
MSVANSVVSSRIRLARNIAGLNFPHRGSRKIDGMFAQIQKILAVADNLFEYSFILMSDISVPEKLALVERHLISPALAENGRTGAVILEKKREISVMLNEEDHIRAQCIVKGFDLMRAYERVNAFDDRLIKAVPIAYDREFGFLTACPTNVGTGMRASVMLHLPALKMSGLLGGPVGEIVRKSGLTLRGVYGEGSASLGGMFQLSNTVSLGLTEEEIIEIVQKACEDICIMENTERKRLLSSGNRFLDKIRRSAGIAKNSILMSYNEFLDVISDLKLGIILGILEKVDLAEIDAFAQTVGPFTLSLATGINDEEGLDLKRAQMLREFSEQKL